MKFFVFAVALLSNVLAVHAGSVWLVMREADAGGGWGVALDKIEMESMEQCEEQGAIFIASKRMGRFKPKYSGFECLEGK